MTEPDLLRARLLASVRADRAHLATLELRVAHARGAAAWGPGALSGDLDALEGALKAR